jgi:malate synthase
MDYTRGVVMAPLERDEHKDILTPEAQTFIAVLHRYFNERRLDLLHKRKEMQWEFDEGNLPDFLSETMKIREDLTWKCAKTSPGLEKRPVEITGPVDRKMVINALNSGATQYMADFEDSHAPTWAGTLDGQVNLRDALRRTIAFEGANGKKYALKPEKELAVLLVRPRGWHMEEKHFYVDGQPVSASLFDFGLYFFHNAVQAMELGYGPYFYLPKLESYLEARLWNDVFNIAQDYMAIPRGTIRATVLCETITGAFQLEEILYELRSHSAGANTGLWDYMFSVLKKLRKHEFVFPDRSALNMNLPFMEAYALHVASVCKRRGCQAMGGMSAFIPGKDPVENERIFSKVAEQKMQERMMGFVGAWASHPALVGLIREIFEQEANFEQWDAATFRIEAKRLLNVFIVPGSITLDGIRTNVSVCLKYLEAWIAGLGCIAVDGKMEDLATAEISRCQLWQWIRMDMCTLDDVLYIMKDEADMLRKAKGQGNKVDEAVSVLRRLVDVIEFHEFSSILAYEFMD